MEHEITRDDVLIIGAGPAGLTAGYLLTQKSELKTRILEVHPTKVGGISRTEEYKGYLFDIGGHRFFSKAQQVEDLWREILPDDFLLRPRKSSIYYKAKFYSYPLRAFEALWNLGFWESGLCVISYAVARLRPILPVKSFRDWVTNQFGARLFRIFFKTYTEKVWGISCDKISADWAAQRIRGLNLAKAILSGLSRSLGLSKLMGGQPKIKTLIEEFRYPRRGPGLLWSAAAQKIKAQGGTIEMGIKATRFEWDTVKQLWIVTAVDGDGHQKLYSAAHIISSAPLSETIPTITPLPTSSVLAEKLGYRDFLTVALMLKTPASFLDNWIYVHDPDVKVGRIQNFASWSPEMIPEAGHGCLGLEYFCQVGDPLWSMTDVGLINLAKDEVVKLGLATMDQIEDGCVVRQPKAYPVYDDNYGQIVMAIRHEFAESYPTFHMVGRNGMHKYNNQDHAMMTAMLTVENILSGTRKFDVWAVNVDAEYHEEDRLQDSSKPGKTEHQDSKSTVNSVFSKETV